MRTICQKRPRGKESVRYGKPLDDIIMGQNTFSHGQRGIVSKAPVLAPIVTGERRKIEAIVTFDIFPEGARYLGYTRIHPQDSQKL